MDPIRALVLSSVVPNALGSGGELVLHRHLKSNPQIQIEVGSWQEFPFRLKVIGKLRQLGFRSLSQAWECLLPVLPTDKMVHDLIHSFRPHVLVTVAHGWWHIKARRVAKQFKLPLVSLFQDWWPDFPEITRAFRSRVERDFRETCSASDVVICVSDGMCRELGEPENALVIHDAPSLAKWPQAKRDFELPLRVAYFGNLFEYGSLMETALRTLNGSDHVRLEVFGPSPLWTSGAEEEFRSRGVYHGFIPSNELPESLKNFQAALVVMSFARSHRRRMITSFPSKMIDAMQLGVPVVIWGPEYCSAVEWARKGERALCVTDANPAAIRRALEELAASPAEQERLAKSARDATEGDFDSERIRAQFTDALRRAIDSQRASDVPTVGQREIARP
jgi:glycosyltransferase involved in cell wall biosynthesis